MPTQDPPNTLGHFLMHVDMKCVRLWESPSPCWADARHGAFVGVHTLYSLYIASTCTKHRYERPAEALQPLQPLQQLYLQPLQYTSLYNTPLGSRPLPCCRRRSAPPMSSAGVLLMR